MPNLNGNRDCCIRSDAMSICYIGCFTNHNTRAVSLSNGKWKISANEYKNQNETANLMGIALTFGIAPDVDLSYFGDGLLKTFCTGGINPP